MSDLIYDDCIRQLCSLDYAYILKLQPLFLTCKNIYTISNSCFNDIIKRDYRFLIRGNYMKNPKNVYLCLCEVYRGKYYICTSLLYQLIKTVISTNNNELMEILFKTVPNSLNSLDACDLIKYALKVKSSKLEYLLSRSSLIGLTQIYSIIDYYIHYKIDSPLDIKSIIDKYSYVTDDLTQTYLIERRLQQFKLFVDDKNCNELLAKAMVYNNKEAAKYIMSTYNYDKLKVYHILLTNYHVNTDQVYKFLTLSLEY